MSIPTRCPRGVFAAEMLIALIVVGSLVLCEDATWRMWLGGGWMLTAVPLTILGAARQTLKVGRNSGYTSAAADLLRTHVALQYEDVE